MAQRFILNGTSYHGKVAIKEIATEAISRGFKKAFVCSDPDLIKFGVADEIIKVFDDNHIPYELDQSLASLKLKSSDEGSTFGNYLQTVRFTDEAFG